MAAAGNQVVPSTWNFGPRDKEGQLGPVEESLIGTPVADPKTISPAASRPWPISLRSGACRRE
ncbi:hypothetical protein DSCOOX_31660 [Desulfosarcina ovata subsp. ovata]|uniref:Uncharacterized protein n=1 Tax=Desulfosarcina ovata subsp. ovata TaxID=2752305 RepID=A0A5K8ABV6_9BACT|nr:hypothetical protein DSCOOX_31660 [Desulfosarcina ovata subsp. ovata]